MQWLYSHYGRYALLAGGIAAILALDRCLKQWAQVYWQAQPLTPVAGVELTYFENRYIAFSIPLQGALLEVAIGVISVGILWLLLRRVRFRLKLQEWGLALLLSGALGNLYDRLRYGFIIDYLNIYPFPVFNLADVAITAGVLMVMFSFKK